MIIESAIKKEEIRCQKMIEEYEERIKELPKGSLICRRNTYYYLKYRKDGKVHDEYVGKDPDVVGELRKRLELRKHCEEMLSALKREKKKSRKYRGLFHDLISRKHSAGRMSGNTARRSIPRFRVRFLHDYVLRAGGALGKNKDAKMRQCARMCFGIRI